MGDKKEQDEKMLPVPRGPVRLRLYHKRWAILGIFVALSCSNAFQWIEYAIIGNIITEFYSVPYIAVDWTSMIYMFNYIPLVFPATWLLDKYGLRIVALLGGFGNCLGAWLKCASAHPDRFYLTFLGQAIVGSSQVFILGIPPRLAAVWFGPKEVSTACALGVFGNQLGIAIGFLVPPMAVRDSKDESLVASDLQYMFFASAAFNSLIFLLIFLFFKDKPPVPPSQAQMSAIEASIDHNFVGSLKSLVTNRNYMLLLVTYGINVGAFYAVSTLLNQMVLDYYPTEQVNIGRIGLLIVLAGMVGSIVCGVWLDRSHMFKLTTLVVYAFSCIGMLVYTFTIDLGHLWVIFIVAAALGFFMTGYLPLGFEFGAELTYPISEGTVSGLLNASAQVFGVAMTLGAGQIMSRQSIFACNMALTVSLLFGTGLTAIIRSDLRRFKASQYQANPSSAALVDDFKMNTMPTSTTLASELSQKTLA